MFNNIKAKEYIANITKKNRLLLKLIMNKLKFLRRKVNLIVLIFFLLVGSLFIILNIPISKTKLLEKLESNFSKSSTLGIAKYIKLDQSKVLPFELEPLIRYYNSNPQEISILIDELKNKGKSGNIILESEVGLFGKNYFININTVKAKFDFTVDGVKASLGKSDIIPGKVSIGLVPGIYDLSYKLNTNYGEVSKIIKVSILDDTTSIIEVNASNIILYSNFDDGKIFINNKNTGVTVDNVKEIGLLPTDKGLTLHLEREFPWGNIKSSNVIIKGELHYKLDINIVNDKLRMDVNNMINSFYNSTFEALNSRNKEFILNSTEEVKSKVYNYIEEKSLLFKNDYKISDLQVIIEKSDFKFEDGLYKGNILTEINYSTFKKLVPFLSKQNNQLFLMQIQYDQDQWVVKDIQDIDINIR